MASASSARRRCWWAPPPRSPLLVAAEASVVAVSAAAAFAVRAWGLAWVWAWVAFTDRMATVAIPTAATIPIMATRALAMRFGDASGQPTVGEYAAFRSASDCGCAPLNLNGHVPNCRYTHRSQDQAASVSSAEAVWYWGWAAIH